MTTFQDMNEFDWTSMVNEERKPEVYQANSMEPGNDVWFDKFIEDAPVISSESVTTTSTGSPLEFSSLFDLQDRSSGPIECESLFSSNVTSLDNSPMIKTEELKQERIPELDLTIRSEITRNASVTSMTSISSDSSESSPAETSASAADIKLDSSASTVKKPKKKRAPRKRLTPHQKQAHNKIEKRYRININAKIAGLQQIIPWVASEKTAFETGDGAKQDEEIDTPRLNKSMILEKATSYILHLQDEEKSMKSQLAKLRAEVAKLGGDSSL